MNSQAIDPSSKKAFAKVLASAGKASAEFRMLEPGDRVLAGLSGGLDSFVMLEVLLTLAQRVPFELTIEAVTFDPGFPELDPEAIRNYCTERKVKHHIIRFDVPTMLAQTPAEERFRRPCVWCSRMRRGRLYQLARENKFNKLALGHHADDLLESFFISLMRGQGLTTMGPNVEADMNHAGENHLRIIRPLAMVTEEQVKTAAGKFEFPQIGSCPYQAELAASGDRAWVKNLISSLAEKIPDLRQLMLKSMGKVELDWLLDKRYLTHLK